MKTTTPRVIPARYTMTPDDEAAAVAIACRAGEQLDASHRLLVGGARSLAGQLGRLLEHRIFDQETGPHTPEYFVDEYAEFEDRSIHAVIVDEAGVLAAARTIWSPTPDAPTKLEVDLGYAGGELRERERLVERYGSNALFELATTVVVPRARHSEVTGWILGEMRYQQMCQSPGTPSCAMVIRPFYRMISVWGHGLAPLAGLGLVDYYGEPNQPTFFEPGPQPQINKSRLYSKLSKGWLERVSRPLAAPMIDAGSGETGIIELPNDSLPVGGSL